MLSTCRSRTPCSTPWSACSRFAPFPACRGGRRDARVLVPGGRLLLDHIGSTWPPAYASQWLAERITIRTAGEHFTRRPLPLVQAAGFQIVESERLKAGAAEHIHAVRPA